MRLLKRIAREWAADAQMPECRDGLLSLAATYLAAASRDGETLNVGDALLRREPPTPERGVNPSSPCAG
jgi:hypothetical protein